MDGTDQMIYPTEIHKQIIAKEKAKCVINSCETQDHIIAADKYIILYRIKFEDRVGYNDLLRLKEEKYQKLISPSC